MRDEIQALQKLNQKYWYEYQSPAVCRLGSDGVGHDLIHPADQLQAACRNAVSLYHATCQIQEDLELKEIEIEELRSQEPTKKTAVLLKRAERVRDQLKLQASEREQAFRAHYDHALELHAVVSKKYSHIDEALPEIWAARVAYQAMVKNHPLGQELKIALMTEDQKLNLMRVLDLPQQLQTPNASMILDVLNERGATQWQKITGSHLELQTQERTPA